MPTFAAVDIGSNSVRLKISRLASHHLVEIHEDREVTRLGESVFSSGFLSPEAIALTVKVLRRFHRAAQKAGADTVRVVATSALRDARNSRAFLEWVRSATGWRVEIISGVEEARLIHLGLTSTMRVNSSSVLMIDLGGGSCELTISNKGHIRETVSLPLGAVRLTNDFLHHDPPRKPELRQLRSLIRREVGRIAQRIIKARPRIVIATSGTAEALSVAAHSLYRTKSQRANAVTRLQMHRIAKMLPRLSLEQRRKVPGIGVRRAEIVIAGAAVYAELVDRLNTTIDELTAAAEQEARKRPEVLRLMTHPGVGPITALAFVLVLGSPDRFGCGRAAQAESSRKPHQPQHLSRQAQQPVRPHRPHSVQPQVAAAFFFAGSILC